MRKQRTYKKLTPEEEEQIRKNLAENPLSRKDYWALFISLFLTLLPRILLVIGFIIGVIWFFFLR
ncbi:MAG TPA: hypothetical protein VIK94_03955 [Bacilli bacterium]